MPKKRPIIFSGEMVKAILEGRKTMTRRIVKFHKPFTNHAAWGCVYPHPYGGFIFVNSPVLKDVLKIMADGKEGKQCHYGQAGDRLWIRETWSAHLCAAERNEKIHYRADGESCPLDGEKIRYWRPSIFMPRWASRITLEITNIRVERLQEITPADVIAEGIIEEEGDGLALRDKFEKLWDSINGKKYPWSSNSWVWVIQFKR